MAFYPTSRIAELREHTKLSSDLISNIENLEVASNTGRSFTCILSESFNYNI